MSVATFISDEHFVVAAHPEHPPLMANFWPPQLPWFRLRLDPMDFVGIRVPRELPPWGWVNPWTYPDVDSALRRPLSPRLRRLVLTVHWIWNMRRPL